MKLRFYNAKIMTMENDCSVIEGELHVENDRIAYIGPEKGEETFDREIDAGGNLLMPGFKNAHTHSAMTFLRSYADDLPLQSWLNDRVFPMEAKLTPDAVYWFSRLAILEYLTSGMTANFDMYMKTDAIAQASIDSGFRTVLCDSINNFGGSVEQMEKDYDRFGGMSDLISYHLGFHAEYTTSMEIMKEIAALANRRRLPVFVHNSETKAEVEGCKERYGMTPTETLESIGMYNYGGGGYHCVHMSEEDIRIFKRRGLYAVTNPASNLKLASGIAPICTFLENEIPVAIGTDGPASNNCLDMFREMFLVTGLQKTVREDAAACAATEVLKMATINGARAMRLDACDCLKKGKKADFIEIDLSQPNMRPLNNIAKNIVYAGSKQNVKRTIVNGKILYEDGSFFVGETPKDIYRKVGQMLSKMK
ncbi:MAG: amidohydrolase [Bacteroides sp.]|nr:amidohydrolase [Eubacterium sp.]MCM1417260.1 amidohydrolase [Roseburia sp.]MCM1461120.1 amidohydrolase [Bacteroides sp.]